MWPEVKELLAEEEVYWDTSFSLDCIEGVEGMLSREEFTEMVRLHGADRIVFGTDSPWSGQRVCIDWINGTTLTDEEKEKIFSGNMKRILGIDN